MQVRFYDIEWDMTDSDKPRTPEECGLPSECVLEVEDDIDLSRDGADVLSQHYGWLVKGVSWRVIGHEGAKDTTMHRHHKTIRIPVEISFTIDPAELDERNNEPAPTKASLVAYLRDTVVLQVDTEDHGQPVGAVFAAAGIDWEAVTLVED